MPIPPTEQTHPKAAGLDTLPSDTVLQILHQAQLDAAQTVKSAISDLARGAEAMANAIRDGHKLVYAAAGSSGLQGLADGLELTPTFGIPIDRIKILRAGGLDDLSRPRGEAEDDEAAALQDGAIINAGDCVICLAASGNTPYAVRMLALARERGARTIGIANNPGTQLLAKADIAILLPTPAEVIAGSTRLGAGTAQKIALNMMSSLMGVRLGHVMDGLMVNVLANNTKISHRAENIVMAISNCGRDTAIASLKTADGNVKYAIMIATHGVDIATAKTALEQADQNLRQALNHISSR